MAGIMAESSENTYLLSRGPLEREIDGEKNTPNGNRNTPIVERHDLIPEENPNQKGTFSRILHCFIEWISRHRKMHGGICGAIPILLVVVFLVMAAVFIAGYVKFCQDELPSNQTLYLAPQSVIEVDPEKYNINTFEHKVIVKSSTSSFNGSITVAVDHDVQWQAILLPLKQVTTHNQSLLRYWNNKYPPIGNIFLVTEYSYIVWSWSSLTGPPLAQNCSRTNIMNTTWSYKDGPIDVSDIYNTRQTDEELVMISFCSETEYPIRVYVSITEYQPVLEQTKSERQPVTLTFPYAVSGTLYHPKIYINTTNLTENDDDLMIDLEMEEYDKGCNLIVGGMVMSLLLFVVLLIIMIGFAVCCCYYKKNINY